MRAVVIACTALAVLVIPNSGLAQAPPAKAATTPAATAAPTSGATVGKAAMPASPEAKPLADRIGTPAPFRTINVVEPPAEFSLALGSAYLAGLTIGYWKDKTELAEHWRSSGRFEPQVSPYDAINWMQRWHEAVRRSLNWAK